MANPLTGGCYCGEVRYTCDDASAFSAQCHCRACQHISGGGPNYFMLVAEASFEFTAGSPRQFSRSDLEAPVTREFCSTCGTHMVTRLPNRSQLVVKAGTLDEPAKYGTPKMAIYCEDKQPFHLIAEGIPAFDKTPPRTKESS